jgi:hypothetical protein
MPKAHSWQHRIPTIAIALEMMSANQLDRSHIEVLFGIQRRAALRLMEAVGPSEHGGEWRVDRHLLLEWVKALGAERSEANIKTARVQQALRDAVSQKQQIKAGLLRLGRPGPASWTLPLDAFSAQVNALPPEVVVSAGRIVVSFSPDDPASGAQLLHQLSLAMLSDWRGFCSQAGRSNAVDGQKEIDHFLAELEDVRLHGLTVGEDDAIG